MERSMGMRISFRTKLMAIALMLCLTVVAGSTLAWFTDSVESTSNVITAGNLDIEVEYTLDGSAWKDLDDASDLFQKSLWEPGHTELALLKIENKGNLAVCYTAQMNIVEEAIGKTKDGADIKLSEILTVQTLISENADDVKNAFESENAIAYGAAVPFNQGNVLDKNQELLPEHVAYIAVKVDMAETVGNEANHNGTDVPSITFGINVVANQLEHESDAFGNNYDADAVEKVIKEVDIGGIKYTLTNTGKLTVSPSAMAGKDESSGKEFAPGVWREAVVYNANGDATAIGQPIVDKNAVKALVIEEGVTSIGSFAAKFPNLTGEVVIPSTVTYIGQEAFQNTQITKLTFAEGGTEPLCIAPGAFKNLQTEEIVLPADRPEIHIHCWVFNDCLSLKHIIFPANVTTFSKWTHVDYCGMDYVDSWDSQILARCYALEKITFGSQAVRDLFFNAQYNSININAIGGVEIEILQ